MWKAVNLFWLNDLTNNKPMKWFIRANVTSMCPVRANTRNVVGMIKEKSLSCELPKVTSRVKPPTLKIKSTSRKIEKQSSHFLIKSCEHLDLAVSELSDLDILVLGCIIKTLSYKATGMPADRSVLQRGCTLLPGWIVRTLYSFQIFFLKREKAFAGNISTYVAS